MNMLATKQICLPTPPQVTPPSQYVPFVKPLSYEFRVAEIVEDEKIVTVKLQMQVWEHDEFGSGNVKQYWQDVPRVKMDKNGIILPV